MSASPAGSRVLVISGGSAVGRATADLFAADGTPVLIAGADAGGSGVRAVAGHDRTAEDASALVDATRQELGGIEVLVRAVRPNIFGPVLDADARAWSAALGEVLAGAFHATRAAAAAMERGGSIIHVASIDAVHAYHGRSLLATVMAGVVGLVRAFAIELASIGIRVNAVIPGPIVDDLGGNVTDHARSRSELRSPSRRLGTAREVASVIRFLAGPGASFMTGQSIRVDGGWASLNQAPEGMRFP